MTRLVKIIGGLLGGVTLLGLVWWALVPKIRFASDAELRAHLAPELLQPLPHPDGGKARYSELLAALKAAMASLDSAQPASAGAIGKPLDVDAPAVHKVLEILASGPLDRSEPTEPIEWQTAVLAKKLTTGVPVAASAGDWQGVRRRMEAAYQLLDQFASSDVRSSEASVTIGIEADVYKATLVLAARRDLPAGLAERLAILLAAERHTPDLERQVLRGEFQLLPLRWLSPDGKDKLHTVLPWQYVGSSDPLQTITLLNDRFVEMSRNAALPVSQWSSAAAMRIQQAAAEEPAYPGTQARIAALWYRIRTNHAPNSAGIMLAVALTDRWHSSAYGIHGLLDQMLFIRTRREQVAAAVAVARFRQRSHREPRDFQELIGSGLLQSVPMDHATEQSLPFDLQSLFKWPVKKPVLIRSPQRN